MNLDRGGGDPVLIYRKPVTLLGRFAVHPVNTDYVETED